MLKIFHDRFTSLAQRFVMEIISAVYKLLLCRDTLLYYGPV